MNKFKKFSQLQTIQNPENDSLVPIVQNGANNNITLSTLKDITKYDDTVLKDKIENMKMFLGVFNSVENLEKITGTKQGQYAYVDEGKDNDVVMYIWDVDDRLWVSVKGEPTLETPQSIKEKYESNYNTNAFTDSDKSLLGSINDKASISDLTSLTNHVDYIERTFTETIEDFGNEINNELNKKANLTDIKTYTAGQNINISEDNIISATIEGGGGESIEDVVNRNMISIDSQGNDKNAENRYFKVQENDLYVVIDKLGVRSSLRTGIHIFEKNDLTNNVMILTSYSSSNLNKTRSCLIDNTVYFQADYDYLSYVELVISGQLSKSKQTTTTNICKCIFGFNKTNKVLFFTDSLKTDVDKNIKMFNTETKEVTNIYTGSFDFEDVYFESDDGVGAIIVKSDTNAKIIAIYPDGTVLEKGSFNLINKELHLCSFSDPVKKLTDGLCIINKESKTSYGVVMLSPNTTYELYIGENKIEITGTPINIKHYDTGSIVFMTNTSHHFINFYKHTDVKCYNMYDINYKGGDPKIKDFFNIGGYRTLLFTGYGIYSFKYSSMNEGDILDMSSNKSYFKNIGNYNGIEHELTHFIRYNDRNYAYNPSIKGSTIYEINSGYNKKVKYYTGNFYGTEKPQLIDIMFAGNNYPVYTSISNHPKPFPFMYIPYGRYDTSDNYYDILFTPIEYNYRTPNNKWIPNTYDDDSIINNSPLKGAKKMIVLTQDEYNTILEKDIETLYFIKE